MSPDNTSDGWLKKKWVIADGKRCLIKGGSPPYHQEPLNEAIAAAIAKRLGIPHVPYWIIWEDGQPYSVCEDFITKETDLVSAWRISQTKKHPGHLSNYQHFMMCCNELGIHGMEHSINQMLTIDYLTVNIDRHFNNFGAVRDARTLEWLGAAPVFDCGTSMWHAELASRVRPSIDVGSKPFRSKHSEQIKLVKNFDWLDFSALRGIDEEFGEILASSVFIDDARRDTLCYALRKRVEMLAEHMRSVRYTRVSMNNDKPML
jgi:hypothetical protein